MPQLLKVTVLVTALVGFLALGWLLAHRGSERRRDAEVRLSTVPPLPGTRPGDPLPPEHERLRDQYERQQYTAAAQQPGAQAFVKDLRPLEPHRGDTLEQNPRWQTASPATPPVPSGPDPERVKAKLAYMNALTAKWERHDSHHTVVYAKPTAEAKATGVAAPSPPPLTLPLTGRIHPATLLVGINSDVPSPVVAILLQPPLVGATLSGRFTRAEEGLLIEFRRLHYQGRAYAVEAYAVDLDTATAAVATTVDRRTFSRWAAVLGSALLGGLQRGVLADTDVITPGLGTVIVERDLSGRDLAAVALGEIGRRTRPLAEQYWNRPPTVTVNEAVGVVFLADVVAVADTSPAPAGTAPTGLAATPATAEAWRHRLERNLGALANPVWGSGDGQGLPRRGGEEEDGDGTGP